MKYLVLTVLLATLILGFTIGLFVGLSKTPVVGVIIPILFSVVGGTTGFYFS